MEQWKSDFLNPIDTYQILWMPQSPFQYEIGQWVLYSFPVSLIIFLTAFYGWIWKRKTFREAQEYGSHGTARWATTKEIFRKGEVTGNPYNERNTAGVILGYQESLFGGKKYITIPPDSEINQNIVVYGGSGIGKDFTYIKTQIFHSMVPYEPKSKKRKQALVDRGIPTEYSLLVVDPKGEAYRDTAVSLEENGYEVYQFNLVNRKSSHRWNGLDYVTDDIEATRLANLIISNGYDKSGGDPFWPKAEKALLTAVILFVKYETPPEQQHIPNVLHIGMTYNNEDELDILFESLPYNHPALGSYRIFKQAPPETRAGILIGFGAELQLFANREITEMTTQSDFKLDDMGRKKTAVFMIIPDGDTTFASITSLFMTQAFQQWWKVAEENGGTCPIGIRVLGNEWANIGRVPMIAERASVMRSKGVSLQIILQGRAQLDKLYDKDAEILLLNCDTTIFLGTNDTRTAEQMEKDLGDMTIEVQTHSKQPGSMLGVGSSVSTQHQARKLRTANEIKKNSRKKNIIIQNASNPFETLKTPFIDHPLANGFKKRNAKDMTAPKHKGYKLFSREDYNRVIGAVLEPSTVSAEAAQENFMVQTKNLNALDILDSISFPAQETETELTNSSENSAVHVMDSTEENSSSEAAAEEEVLEELVREDQATEAAVIGYAIEEIESSVAAIEPISAGANNEVAASSEPEHDDSSLRSLTLTDGESVVVDTSTGEVFSDEPIDVEDTLFVPNRMDNSDMSSNHSENIESDILDSGESKKNVEDAASSSVSKISTLNIKKIDPKKLLEDL